MVGALFVSINDTAVIAQGTVLDALYFEHIPG